MRFVHICNALILLIAPSFGLLTAPSHRPYADFSLFGTISKSCDFPQQASSPDKDDNTGSDETEESGDAPEPIKFRIREPTYREMSFVADIFMRCFYAPVKGPTKQLYRIGELNRIQQNFPYDPEQHRMLVATAQELDDDKDRIIAFCDIDVRTPNQSMYKYNPRPYLSDLCVDPDFQRRGIAQELVTTCEQFALDEWESNQVFIRVERTNEPALAMYTKLGYSEITHPDNDSTKIMLLRKNLKAEQSQDKNDLASMTDVEESLNATTA